MLDKPEWSIKLTNATGPMAKRECIAWCWDEVEDDDVEAEDVEDEDVEEDDEHQWHDGSIP